MGAVGVRIRMGRLLRGARVVLRFLMEDICYFIYTSVYTSRFSVYNFVSPYTNDVRPFFFLFSLWIEVRSWKFSVAVPINSRKQVWSSHSRLTDFWTLSSPRYETNLSQRRFIGDNTVSQILPSITSKYIIGIRRIISFLTAAGLPCWHRFTLSALLPPFWQSLLYQKHVRGPCVKALISYCHIPY